VFYVVWNDFRITEARAYPAKFHDPKAHRFSTEQAAKEYVENNKPILSAKEVYSCIEPMSRNKYLYLDEERLKQLIEQKINNGNNG